MKKFYGWTWAIVALVALFAAPEAQATSQWGRKYKMNCQSCHTAIPRLTYFGEKFARNGYQLPDTEDGDENKEKLSDSTFIDNIGNLFGFRISLSPVEVKTKTFNSGGTYKTSVNFGDSKWIQFFTAGTIFKNTSIFVETEVESTAIHFNWFTLGYHNLLGTSWLNLRTGKLSMLNWHSQTGRLRMIPNINVEATRFRPSQGTNRATATEPIRIGQAVPALELYGYGGPFLYSVGVSNGEDLDDTNTYKNFFNTLRLEMPDGALAGSSISSFGMLGWDVANRENKFYRLSGAANLRWKKWDVIGMYVYGREDNYNLDTTNVINKASAYSTQVGYLFNPYWFTALQYDYVKDTQSGRDEFHKVSQHVSYMPRENMRIGLTLREELKKNSGGRTGRQHEALVNVRAMF